MGRLPELQPIIEEQLYFVLHAPRQTGETTAMRAFADALRARGVEACWGTLGASQGIDETALAEPLWIAARQDGATELPDARRHGPDHGLGH